jgi:hypothetical protein
VVSQGHMDVWMDREQEEEEQGLTHLATGESQHSESPHRLSMQIQWSSIVLEHSLCDLRIESVSFLHF